MKILNLKLKKSFFGGSKISNAMLFNSSMILSFASNLMDNILNNISIGIENKNNNLNNHYQNTTPAVKIGYDYNKSSFNFW